MGSTALSIPGRGTSSREIAGEYGKAYILRPRPMIEALGPGEAAAVSVGGGMMEEENEGK